MKKFITWHLSILRNKVKTNTLYPSNKNIEFGVKNITIIRSINFKENVHVNGNEEKFSLSNQFIVTELTNIMKKRTKMLFSGILDGTSDKAEIEFIYI